jgi:hypothetical protein
MENAKAVISPYDNTQTASYNFESPNPFLSKMSSPIDLAPHAAEKVAFVNMGNAHEVSRNEFVAVPYDASHSQTLSNISGDGQTRFYAPTPVSKPKGSKDSDPNNAKSTQYVKDNNDHVFHFYIGSLTVIGLFILFRVVQKT